MHNTREALMAKEFILVVHENKHYNIEKSKVKHVLEILSKKEIKTQDDNEIIDLMKKHYLFDDIFLAHINKLW